MVHTFIIFDRLSLALFLAGFHWMFDGSVFLVSLMVAVGQLTIASCVQIAPSGLLNNRNVPRPSAPISGLLNNRNVHARHPVTPKQ